MFATIKTDSTLNENTEVLINSEESIDLDDLFEEDHKEEAAPPVRDISLKKNILTFLPAIIILTLLLIPIRKRKKE